MSNRRKVRVPPSHEQFETARRQARDMMARTLPGADVTCNGMVPAWVIQLMGLDSLDGVVRCEHLSDRPVQPAIALANERVWRCQACMAEHAQLVMAAVVPASGQAEERTCDLCRHDVGSGVLSPLVMRQDIWTVVAALCATCYRWALSNGTSEWRPPEAMPRP